MRRLLTLVAISLLAGCAAKPERTPPYTGPTDPIDVVVAKINERNTRIDKLWATGDFSANLIDPQTKKATTGSGDVTLLYMPQRHLRLRGKVLTETVFDIGSNNDRYWLIVPPQETMWWGYHRLIGSSAQGLLPIRPDLLTEVLGVGPIDTDLLKEPAPVMRFNNDAHAYMFTWQVQLPDRWVVQKEVWYDRETLLPRLVLLFDENGRIVLRAYLTEPETVTDGFEPPVRLATKYSMYFPETGSTFQVDLKDIARTRRGVPAPRSFNFPSDPAGVEKVIQIDE